MRNRIVAVLLAGMLATSTAGCTAGPAPTITPTESSTASSTAERPGYPETVDVPGVICAEPSPGPGELVASQCLQGEKFILAGTDAVATSLGTTTFNDTGTVELTLTLANDAASPMSALLHIEDPRRDFAEVLVAPPAVGAECLGHAGVCELGWGFSGTGNARDVALGFAPQMWVQLSDGNKDIVIWIVRVAVE